MLPLISKNRTVALNAHRGTPRMAFLMNVVRSPAPSARPMAICIASTSPRGAKLEKFFSIFWSSQTRPSRLMMLRTATILPVVGLVTWTPIPARTADRTIKAPVMYRKRMNGNAFPIRSMVPKNPFIFGAAAFSAIFFPAAFINIPSSLDF